jgi:type IV secretory pathway VirJ component
MMALGVLMSLGNGQSAPAVESVDLRGHPQLLRMYGRRGAQPILLCSGDGGWIHLGPHTAQALADDGFFVVGFDVKSYLSSFTFGRATLRAEDEPADFRALIEFTARGSTLAPILIGISEGAGLSVLAAADAETRKRITGVITLGMPDRTELGWRWKDALIYVTHGAADEPSFSTAAIIAKVSPAPLVAIHSTRDEFVARSEIQRVMSAARDPKQLWMVDASDHRFSGNLAEFDRRLVDAIAWVRAHAS